MLPVKTPTKTYKTLEEIKRRKEELCEEMQRDNEKFSSLWRQIFVSKKKSTKGEYLTSVVSNGITAVDTVLLVRKLMKNYGPIFKRKKK
mgnify:CR=1 FL=1|jgi:hypothetical protein